MKHYTVVLIVPDYTADTFGQSTYTAYLRLGDKNTIKEIVEVAQEEAYEELELTTGSPQDFYPVFIAAGHHDNLAYEFVS